MKNSSTMNGIIIWHCELHVPEDATGIIVTSWNSFSWLSAAFLDRALEAPWSGLAPENGSEWAFPPRTHAQLVKLSPPVVQPGNAKDGGCTYM